MLCFLFFIHILYPTLLLQKEIKWEVTSISGWLGLKYVGLPSFDI